MTPASDTPAAAARPGPERPRPASAAPAPEGRFASGHAGLLFLLNAFVVLRLYPDFTGRPAARIRPSPLWLTDAVGRYWFGAPYRRDPLSRWIAAHARGGHLPASWRIEPDWLAGFAAAPATPVERDGRIALWHEAGFPLADLAARQPPRRLDAHARRCRCRRRPVGPARPARLPRLPRNPAARWIACLAHYLDARLRIAAGDPALGLASLALPGEIEVRGLELVARFRLDSHPIGLRIAGLDRDLGWQPAEGRSIGFRFA